MKKISLYLALSLCACLGACWEEPTQTRDTTYVVMAYPNPAREVAKVVVNNTSTSYGTLTVFDPDGDVLLENEVAPGRDSFGVELTSDGKYHVVFKLENKIYTTTFLAL